MLKISRLADYATRVLFFLTAHPQQRYSANQVASGINISAPTVSKVLKLLNEAKLVNSERGVNGGYQLAKAPDEIQVAEVIVAIDGRVAMTDCSKGDNICAHHQSCELRNHWQSINSIVSNVLRNLTLADMQRPLNPNHCVCRKK